MYGEGRRRWTPRPPERASQLAHKLGISHRTWPRGVEHAFHLFALDCPQEHLIQIAHVQPAYVLPACADSAAEKALRQVRKRCQRAAITSKREADSEQYLSGLR